MNKEARGILRILPPILQVAHRAAVPGVPAGVVSQHGGVAEGVGEGQLYLQHLGQGIQVQVRL